MKVGGHRQTDVLAGFALGTMAGHLAHKQDSPWILRSLPGGFEAGLKVRFWIEAREIRNPRRRSLAPHLRRDARLARW
jgi:hypothetical protein